MTEKFVRVNYGKKPGKIKPYWKCKGCGHPFPSGEITMKKKWNGVQGKFVDRPHFEFSNDGKPCMNGEYLDLEKKCPYCMNAIVNQILS